MKKIKCLLKEPSKEAVEIEIEDTLENYQKLVGGDIEVVSIGRYRNILPENIVFVVNDVGLIIGLKPNIMHGLNYLAGNIVVAKTNSLGEFVDLNNEDIKLAKSYLLEKANELFLYRLLGVINC
ncbi:MAG: DUF3846 domain-containing protein [Eubacteriales bacterium]|nr:DUF3846 domain-containing protein [Eubacteriales bacterium]